MTPDIIRALGGPPPRSLDDPAPEFLVLEAAGHPAWLAAYAELRAATFVDAQGLFSRHDRDAYDEREDTRVLVAVAPDGDVLGGVRLHRSDPLEQTEIGWWRGSRLVCDRGPAARRGHIGAALVRAACATAVEAGALRFDAHVQPAHVAFFSGLGWARVRDCSVAGAPHVLMRWPVPRIADLAAQTKAPLGPLLAEMLPHDRFRGDDAAPVSGTDAVCCVDAIVPAMVERDPEWAGWCGMLVTAHDLAAMGARPVGVLDALAAPDAAHAERVLAGMRRGAEAFALPVLGGHTTLGAPAALSVTGLGRTRDPVAASGGQVGDVLTLTADLAGGWRPGYRGRQWDSTSARTHEQLRPMLDVVARARPHAAKDVSMAGVVGTAGMLAEASGCGVELIVDAIPRPAQAGLADWLTCFPGLAMLTADAPGVALPPAGEAVSAPCGRLTAEPGVRLRWPDGDVTEALPAGVTGLGEAT